MLKTGITWVIVFALLLSVDSCRSGSSSSSASAESLRLGSGLETTQDLAQRINRVENGLLPPTVIKGQSVARMNLAERMKHYKVPGVSVAVINNGVVEWARGYGVVEAGQSKPVTNETLFQAASISKFLAAAASLHYVQMGKLNLDEDVNKRLVSWKVPENEFTADKKVTLRRLLSHTAGLTVSGFGGYLSNEPLPMLVQILDGQKPANSAAVRVAAVPGTRWLYSGGGYCVIQQLLIDVLGKPFPEIMQETILKKIGMKNSTFQQPPPPNFVTLATSGHTPNGEAIKGKAHTFPEMAAAGLWTTPSDLALFAIEIQKSISGKSDLILSRDMASQMLTSGLGGWGLGVTLEGSGTEATFSHGGSNVGFRSFLVAYERTGQGAAVMTNSDNGQDLASEIVRSISVEYGWPTFGPAQRTRAKVDFTRLLAYNGTYELYPTVLVKIVIENDRMFMEAQGSRTEFFPESETRFFAPERDWQLDFKKDQGGAVNEIVAKVEGLTLLAKRVK